MQRNINGLSYVEWLRSAGKTDTAGLAITYHDAWKAGEDPCDWRNP